MAGRRLHLRVIFSLLTGSAMVALNRCGSAGDSGHYLSRLDIPDRPMPPGLARRPSHFMWYLYKEMADQADKLAPPGTNKLPAKVVDVTVTRHGRTRGEHDITFSFPKDEHGDGYGELTRVEMVLTGRRSVLNTGITRLEMDLCTQTGNESLLVWSGRKTFRSVHGLVKVSDVTDLIALARTAEDAKSLLSLTFRIKETVARRRYHLNVGQSEDAPQLLYYFNIRRAMSHKKPPMLLGKKMARNRRSLLSSAGGARARANREFIQHAHPADEVCARHDWYVSFSEMGWGSWIISPSGYRANYCHGGCPVALLRDAVNVTNHAYITAMYRQTMGDAAAAHLQRPLCAPLRLSPISLLYTDKEGQHVLVTLPEMVADQCGCL